MFGKTTAWDDSDALLCIRGTDALHQAPLVLEFLDDSQSLADAQAEFVGMARFERGHDLHGHESNLGANMVATRPVRGAEGVLAADWKDVERGLGLGLGTDSKSNNSRVGVAAVVATQGEMGYLGSQRVLLLPMREVVNVHRHSSVIAGNALLGDPEMHIWCAVIGTDQPNGQGQRKYKG